MSSPALVEKVRGHTYEPPLTHMRQYLDAMDQARYQAVRPLPTPRRVLGALGPKMLELAGNQALGAHPYLTTPLHTQMARKILGSDALLAPEQMVVFSTDPGQARSIARKAVGSYLRAPGYLANLQRLGFTADDWVDPKAASDRLIDSLVAWGDAESIRARIQEHLSAGADHVAVQVLRSDGQIPVEDWAQLASVMGLTPPGAPTQHH